MPARGPLRWAPFFDFCRPIWGRMGRDSVGVVLVIPSPTRMRLCLTLGVGRQFIDRVAASGPFAAFAIFRSLRLLFRSQRLLRIVLLLPLQSSDTRFRLRIR